MCEEQKRESWTSACHKCLPNALVKYVGKRKASSFSILKLRNNSLSPLRKQSVRIQSLSGTWYLSSVQLLSHVRLFATPWTAARRASLSTTNSQSLLKLMSIELVMQSNHLILCCPLLLMPFPSIRVFSNESILHVRWPKYWSFSFSISPSNEYSGLISFRINWFDLLAGQGILKSLSSTTIQKHQFFRAPPSLWSNSHIHTWLLEKL